MPTTWIVKALYEFEDSHARFSVRVEAMPIKQLTFECGEEALGHRVVVGVSDRTHGGANACLPTAFAELDRSILRALIRVVDYAVRPPLPERHLKGIEHELRVQGGKEVAIDQPTIRRLNASSTTAR